MAASDASKPKEPPKPVQIGGESLADRILPHLKKIIVVLLILAAITSVIFGFRACKHRGQVKNTGKLAQVLEVAQRPVTPPAPELPGMPKPEPKAGAFATSQERAKAVLEEMRKQDATAPSAYRASVLLEAGELDAAIEEYKRGQDAEGMPGVLAREGLGAALEAKAAAEKDAAARGKLLEEALATYQRMQPDEKGPRHVYALYHQGRLQAGLGKTAEAKTLFEKASALLSTDPRHELKELLQKRLAAMGAA